MGDVGKWFEVDHKPGLSVPLRSADTACVSGADDESISCMENPTYRERENGFLSHHDRLYSVSPT